MSFHVIIFVGNNLINILQKTLIVAIAIVVNATFIYDEVIILCYEIISGILFKNKHYKKAC